MIELSIIIPHYNSVNSLKALIKSIPKMNEIQIIVIDDKSDKNINEYNEMKSNSFYSNVEFIDNITSKKGAGVCRNLGLNHALGKWILFADADDYFLNDFYNKIKPYFSSDNDVIYFTPTSLELDTNRISDRHLNFKHLIDEYITNKDIKSELYLKYKFIVPWSKLIRREIISNNFITFDETIAANDVMFSTKLGNSIKQFAVSTDIIYCVTKSRGSLTTNISKRIFEDRRNVFIRYNKYLKEHLDRECYNMFNFSGREYIVNAIKFKLGISTILSTYMIMKKNKIKIFDLILLNPLFIFKKIFIHYNDIKENKKYRVK